MTCVSMFMFMSSSVSPANFMVSTLSHSCALWFMHYIYESDYTVNFPLWSNVWVCIDSRVPLIWHLVGQHIGDRRRYKSGKQQSLVSIEAGYFKCG